MQETGTWKNIYNTIWSFYEIWGSHGGEVVYYSFLDYDFLQMVTSFSEKPNSSFFRFEVLRTAPRSEVENL
jgi:hypothetical protein